MLRAFLTVINTLIMTLVGGCQMSPNYPVERVVFDEGLLGTWKEAGFEGDVDPDAEAMSIKVERRKIPVGNGRANPQETLGVDRSGWTTIDAYLVTLEGHSKVLKGGDGFPDPIQFEAYLIKVGDHRLLTGQVTMDQLAKGAPYPLAIPVHYFMRLDRKDEIATVIMPAEKYLYGLHWLPSFDPGVEDPKVLPVAFPDPPAENQKPARGFFATGSIDRALEYYDAAAKMKYWTSDPKKYRRIAPESPPPAP